MSKHAEQLQLLIEKVENLKESQSIQTILESMGFFALQNLIEVYDETKETVINAEKLSIGGVIAAIRERLAPKNPRTDLNIQLRSAFAVTN